MKLFVLLLLLSISHITHAIDIEGDINNDGILSGSEQYLLDNPSSIKADRETVTRIVRKLKIQEEEKERREEEYAILMRNRAIQQSIANQQRSSSNNSSGTQQAGLDEQKRELDARQSQLDSKQAELDKRERVIDSQPYEPRSIITNIQTR